VDLQTLFMLFWRRRWILIAIPLIAMSVALMVRIFGVWKYKSTAQIATGITVSNELIDKEKYFNPYEIQVAFTNLTEMIKSRSVLGQLSYKLVEHDLQPVEKPFRTPANSKFEKKIPGGIDSHKEAMGKILTEKYDALTLLDPKMPEQRVLQKVTEVYEYDYESLTKELSITRLNNSDFIEISYTSENPELSAFVVNTLCTELIRYYTAIKLIRSNVSLESLVSIVDQRKKYLDEKLEELKKFNSNNEIFNSDLEGEAQIRQKKEYETQISDEDQKIRGYEVSLTNLENRISELEGSSGGNKPNEQIVTLTKEINKLNQRYVATGQRNPVLRDSLTLLRTQLQGALNSTSSSASSSKELKILKEKREETLVLLEISKGNLNSLTKIFQSMRYSMGNFASKEAISNALEKEAEVARSEYLSAQERYNNAKEKLVTNKMTISQVLFGEAPEKPESGKTVILLIFTGILSFGLCAFVIVLLHLSDSRIKTVQRLKDFTGIPVAGAISEFSQNAGELGWQFFTDPNGQAKELNNLNHDLRKIRFEIESKKAQVLLITSTQKGQGKSFVTMALAHTLSLIQKRILIVDTNMRNNSLTKMLIARVSLLNLMESYQHALLLNKGDTVETKAPQPNSPKALITQTKNKFVDIIGNKTSPLSPLELIPVGDFVKLIQYLRSQYDYIILEGAGLNDFSDTRELERFVDLIIPVFSAEASLNDQDKESVEYLKSLQEKLGPAILNRVESQEKSK
jgi:polysaccharide biosynthesis transport protein